MKPRAFKRIWGKPWDYAYLLELEQYKIREMCEYLKKHHTHVDWELQVREMTICIKLIDIILGKDKYYLSWLHNCFGSIPHKNLPFPVYINTRNFRRFRPHIKDFVKEYSPLYHGACADLRTIKALHLYNKIRAFKMFSWWD